MRIHILPLVGQLPSASSTNLCIHDDPLERFLYPRIALSLKQAIGVAASRFGAWPKRNTCTCHPLPSKIFDLDCHIHDEGALCHLQPFGMAGRSCVSDSIDIQAHCERESVLLRHDQEQGREDCLLLCCTEHTHWHFRNPTFY